jgi:Spx/MgsR family transcriptional regulator
MKKARFYWRSTCSTCRNARMFLRSDLGAELEERDYARQPFTLDELRAIFAGHDPRSFINPKSPAFKSMHLKGRELSAEEALKLMAEEPRLIKRPLIGVDSELLAGFDRERLRELLS